MAPHPPVTVHAICGGVGAGKSTLAHRLSQTHGALLFSGDKWMARLFFPDLMGPPDFDWIWARIGRLEEQIWEEVQQAAGIGVSSVLDLGLTTPDHRAKFAELAQQAELGFVLHWIDLPASLRWARTQKRNEERGETFAMPVSRENFDFVEGMWVEPDAAERLALNIRRYDEAALDAFQAIATTR